MKKKLLAAALVATLCLTGCGNTATNETQKETKTSEIVASDSAKADDTQEVGTESDKKTQVLLWHVMSGDREEQLQVIVDGFNASQDTYEVVAESQGDYDEAAAKFLNMAGEDGSPAIMQIGDQHLQAMIDSQLVENISDMMDKYGYDNKLLPQVENFYTVDGTMSAMPFNSSSGVIYYNVEALKKAGIDTPPDTFEGLIEAAPAIAEANEGMKEFSITSWGYLLDQILTNSGYMIVNNDNGRSAKATEAVYGEGIQRFYQFISDLDKAGGFVNYGESDDDINAGFNNGDISMFITTSAWATSIIRSAPFEVGIACLPHFADKEAQGVYASGGAFVMAKDLNDDVQKGAFEFLKYATSSEVQATWAANTGYFPVNQDSYDTETMKQLYTDNPQMKIASDQLRNAKVNEVTAGPLVTTLVQIRNDMMAGAETVFNGGDPKEAADMAVESTNQALEAANLQK